jgi:HEAT repeat protein
MVAFNVVGRFRQQNDLHAFRRRLAGEIHQDSLLHLLPALLDLPLEIIDSRGVPRTLAEIIQTGQHTTLAGPSGGGRRLALQQWALHWATGDQPGSPMPALLALARFDDGVSAPDRLLGAFIQASILAAETKPNRDALTFFRRGTATPDPEALPARSLLLIHGWDELPAERRASWRAALLDAARTNPAVSIVLTHPLWEAPWPGFTRLALAPVSPTLVTRWVEQLAPAEHRARLLQALMPGGQLRPLAERLFEIALLAWLAPRTALPRTRGELYAQATAELLGLPAGRMDTAPILKELQLLAAYDERPVKITTNLVELGGGGLPHFVHPQVGRYFAARQIVAEGRYDLLHQLASPERAEIAVLIATMLDDPSPLFKALWADGRLHADDALTLGRCLRERAPANAMWVLRVIGGLAGLAHKGTPAIRALAHTLLAECMPALDANLEGLVRADEALQRFLTKLFELLPNELARPRMLRLIYHAEAAESFGWSLADRVIEHGLPDPAETTPAVADQPVLARWVYIQALKNSTEQNQLDPVSAAAGLEALAVSKAGETRKLHAAAALLDNPAQAPATRRAALALLAESKQPAALTVIERASADANPEVRAAALDALSRHDPDRATVALGRAAIDDSAAWELRLEAIEHLGHQPAIGAGRVLARCAADATLPLYARLRAIVALGQQTDGPQYLLQIIAATEEHPEVRAAAARQLAAARHSAAVSHLLRLLDATDSPLALVEGCCDALGTLGTREATGPLIRLLAHASADVTLTLAAAQALGQIGDPEAIEPLSRLLGAEALHRLQQAVEPRLHDQALAELAEDPALPRAIALRLAATLASSQTAEARPTTLAEFLIAEADLVRAGSANALAAIGGNGARAALLAALLDDDTGGATADVIGALAKVEGSASAEALGYLLETPEINPLTRWLIVRHLTDHPAGEEVMRRSLARAETDAFTRGALAEGLGQRGAFAALPALRQIAEDRTCDQQLRAQALLALGLLNEQASETALIRMIADPQEETALRGLAAEHLPEQLSAEGRRFLRDLLRNERPPSPIVVGTLRALGHVRDREALPLMLRYGQDEHAEIAQAAITALTDLGDGSVAPMLVRIAHQTGADHTLRLQAAGALLRIGGEGYRPLLRGYLEHGPLPLRLLALEHLIASGTATTDMLAMLATHSWPQTLRLRLIEYFANDTAAAPTLLRILETEDDDPQLRCLAAEALGRMQWANALPTLVRLAADPDSAAPLRLRCIDTLQQLGGTAAWAALSRLAEDNVQPHAIRASASQVLRRAR